MPVQTITEATARELLDGIHALAVALAVATEKLQAQVAWNEEQRKTNADVAEKINAMGKENVARDAEIKHIRDWKDRINHALTSVLISVLVLAVLAVLYLTFGTRP